MKLLFATITICVLTIGAFAQRYTIQQYLNIKSASAPTFSPDARHVAYLTNTTGTQQVWVVDLPTGTPRQLTNYDDNVGFVKWLGDGSGLIFGKAKGGDENTQFFWMKPDGSGVRALTDEPTVRHNFGLASDDGKTIYYASNQRVPNYFEIYSMDIASGKETLLVHPPDGDNEIVAVNSNATKIIISRDGPAFSLDNDLFLIDLNSKFTVALTP